MYMPNSKQCWNFTKHTNIVEMAKCLLFRSNAGCCTHWRIFVIMQSLCRPPPANRKKSSSPVPLRKGLLTPTCIAKETESCASTRKYLNYLPHPPPLYHVCPQPTLFTLPPPPSPWHPHPQIPEPTDPTNPSPADRIYKPFKEPRNQFPAGGPR
jgi:hypothetical protein